MLMKVNEKMEWLMELALILVKMVIIIQDIGLMINNMVMEKNKFKMECFTKGSIIKEPKMVKAN